MKSEIPSWAGPRIIYDVYVQICFILIRTWGKILWLVFYIRNITSGHRNLRVSIYEVSLLFYPEGQIAQTLWRGNHCCYKELEFLGRLIRPNMVFLDIGANVGLFSMYLARKEPLCDVRAFEPCSSIFKVLTRNILHNNIPNIRCYQMALGAYCGFAQLQINSRGKDGLNVITMPKRKDCHIVGSETVSLNTLDKLITNRVLEKVDLIKIDVEGAELMVFQGAERLLSSVDSPDIFFEGYRCNTESFGYLPDDAINYLRIRNYNVYFLDMKTGELLTLDRRNNDSQMYFASKKRGTICIWCHPDLSFLQKPAKGVA